jgi:hypothetical protein
MFVSRLGNAYTAPDWFIKGLPTHMSLDGELFAGRGQFADTVSVVKVGSSLRKSKVCQTGSTKTHAYVTCVLLLVIIRL